MNKITVTWDPQDCDRTVYMAVMEMLGRWTPDLLPDEEQWEATVKILSRTERLALDRTEWLGRRPVVMVYSGTPGEMPYEEGFEFTSSGELRLID